MAESGGWPILPSKLGVQLGVARMRLHQRGVERASAGVDDQGKVQ
jgi:hypothetical protein